MIVSNCGGASPLLRQVRMAGGVYISQVEFLCFYDLSTLEDRPKRKELSENLR